ncbi:carbon-nitrogen hydrolase [Helicobacter sp. 16-1353]|nr:carbon-nitrogen hydrolase [Helicobacter sp. 16-1353]RAX54995.1 carbon-nitrogen hydrolase [Helicobacter sp. 16-1353]
MQVALIQHSFKQTKEKTIEYTLEMIRQAAINGADLVVLQELHTSEYFCQSENVDFFKYAESFENEIEIFSQVARKNNIVLVTSLFEKRANGLYHNTAVVFEKDGSIAGKYRKMHIPDDPGFYEKFYFTIGDNEFRPIETSIGKLGILICWDQWFPEAARLMTLGGAEILIYPTAIGFSPNEPKEEQNRQLNAWLGVQKGHAIANGVFVIAVNRVGFEENKLIESIESKTTTESKIAESSESKIAQDSTKYADSAKSNQINGIEFWGHSFIFGPQGEEIAMAKTQNDEIIKAIINMDRIAEVRHMWPFLRDRRIEFYQNITKRFID